MATKAFCASSVLGTVEVLMRGWTRDAQLSRAAVEGVVPCIGSVLELVAHELRSDVGTQSSSLRSSA